VTEEEFDRLVAIGVLGERVELIDGRITFGRYPLMFSAEAVAAARAAGVELSASPRSATPSRVTDRSPSAPMRASLTEQVVRQHWRVLERVVVILTQSGGAGLTLAASWCGSRDEALDGLSPAAWLERGGDPERLLQLARHDAARLSR
jgi:hypothetical protein